MDMLLKEMQEMDKFVQQPVPAPSVINEVSKINNQDHLWSTGPIKSDESLAEVRNMPMAMSQVDAGDPANGMSYRRRTHFRLFT